MPISSFFLNYSPNAALIILIRTITKHILMEFPYLGHLFTCALRKSISVFSESRTDMLNFNILCLGKICKDIPDQNPISEWKTAIGAPSKLLISNKFKKMQENVLVLQLLRGLLVMLIYELSHCFHHCSEISADSFFKFLLFYGSHVLNLRKKSPRKYVM
jgi:hypothetical protein